MNHWIGQQETWAKSSSECARGCWKSSSSRPGHCLSPRTSPRRLFPRLPSSIPTPKFTGRRIAAFSFIGVRYIATQWNDMMAKSCNWYMNWSRRRYTRSSTDRTILERHFAAQNPQGIRRSRTESTLAPHPHCGKIDLLKCVFDICEIDASEPLLRDAAGCQRRVGGA